MLITIDPKDRSPIYRQITDQVLAAIESGSIAEGDRLPAARALAGDLDVNMHTVLKAYAELREAGIVELRRGRGAVIVATPEGDWLDASAASLVDEAIRRGLTAEGIVAAIESAAHRRSTDR